MRRVSRNIPELHNMSDDGVTPRMRRVSRNGSTAMLGSAAMRHASYEACE